MASQPDRTARNLADTASGMTLQTVGNALSVTVSASDVNRIFFEFHNLSNVTLMLKLYPAADDNDATKGIPVKRGEVWRMPVGTIYTGEISVITSSGNNKSFTHAEY